MMQSGKKRSRQDSQVGLGPSEDVVIQHIDSPSSEYGMQLTRENRFRNLYKKLPDFRTIAQLDPDFAKQYVMSSNLSLGSSVLSKVTAQCERLRTRLQ